MATARSGVRTTKFGKFFGLPMGLLMLWIGFVIHQNCNLAPKFHEELRAGLQKIDGKLLSLKLEYVSGKHSHHRTTFSYQYQVGKRTYRGSRATTMDDCPKPFRPLLPFGGGSGSNIFHGNFFSGLKGIRLYNYLEDYQLQESGKQRPLPVYVDPKNPFYAILFPEEKPDTSIMLFAWVMYGFGALFTVLGFFGLLGFIKTEG